MKKLLLIMLVVAGLMLVQMALAKGPPAKVTISGGDLAEEIEIADDESTLTALGTMYLEEHETRSRQEPEGISGDGYLITRYFVDDMADEDEFFPFDQVRFYPNTDGYSSGYIYYIGMAEGASEYDGLWFRASREGQAALENAIAAAEAEADASSASASQRIGIFELFFSAIAQFMSAY